MLIGQFVGAVLIALAGWTRCRRLIQGLAMPEETAPVAQKAG